MNPLVLVVEEQPALRARYEQFLRDEGYEVVTAATAEGLLSLAQELSPKAVVLDPDAGGGEGMEAALQLLEVGLPTLLVFNTSQTDFSTWVADAYTVRTHGVGELGRTLRQLLKPEPATSAAEN